MDNKIKAIVIAAAVAAAGMIGYGKISEYLNKDPVITSIQADFVGEVKPGGTLSKGMFEVKGVTDGGKLVKLNSFSAKTDTAAENGATCEVEIESQGQTATAIVDITREPVFSQDVGYPNEQDANVTCYSNGDLEFTGKGDVTNFLKTLPWAKCKYTHVYIDETLDIESMDAWFKGNKELVYCSSLPKKVKTMKNTFSGCIALEKTPDYFQCSNLKIMDYAFEGCTSLKEADVIPVNVSSMQYTFSGCTSLQKPISLSKTSNLTNVSGMYNGCVNLRDATEIPDTVVNMDECYKGCINIKEAVKFPMNIQTMNAAYEGDEGLTTGAAIPESAIDFSDCYNGCSALSGSLEINSDSGAFNGVLTNATTNGDKLSISGNSGNLLAIQKDSGNNNIILADPEAAAKQNERMKRDTQ